MIFELDSFVNWLRNKNLKETTIQKYCYYFNKFIHHQIFNQETVSKFLSENKPSFPCRSFLVNFKKFLLVNHRSLNISDEQYKDIVQVELPKITGRKKSRLINPLKKEQILYLEKFLETEEEKIQLLISFFCGLRLGEMIKIQILSFNWEEWREDITQIGECRVYGKGDKEGIALVPAFLMQRIAKFIKGKNFTDINNRIFTNQERTWQRKLLEAGIKSGITKLDENKNPIKETRIHPHRLRHSFAYHLLKDKKLDIRYIQEALRHVSIANTQIYTLVDKEDLKKQLQGS